MEWYYAAGDDRKGPVADGEFQSLVQQGVIQARTLVWHEGLTEWQPHGSLAATPAKDAATVCGSCGRKVAPTEIFALSGVPYCATCKPQILQRITAGEQLASQAAVELRNAHIKHEASIKSVGVLYCMGGVVIFAFSLLTIFNGVSAREGVGIVVGGLFLVLGVGQFWTGWGLRRLRNWARIPTGFLSAIGLLGFPIGTIINGYILYLIFSEKGAKVCSAEYQAVIQQTPHIKYRTSIVVWTFLGLLLLILGFVIISAIAEMR